MVTSQEAGRAGQGIDDEILLGDAQTRSRILLTQNREDFKKLHKKGLPHQGIVVCTYDPDAEGFPAGSSRPCPDEEPGGAGWSASSGRTRVREARRSVGE